MTGFAANTQSRARAKGDITPGVIVLLAVIVLCASLVSMINLIN